MAVKLVSRPTISTPQSPNQSLEEYLVSRISSSLEDFSLSSSSDFSEYADDPVRWGNTVLQEQYTPDIETYMRSVVHNPITIGQTANSVGKTHAKARIAVWFYLVYPDAQVYTFAAPPEANLKMLLWGQIGSIVENHPHLFRNHKVSLSSMNISRSSISFLTGVTIPASGTVEQRQARFSGKHAPHILFLGDEVDACPDEVFKGADSCMSGGHSRAMYSFNPKIKAGHIYNAIITRQAATHQVSALTHPNVVHNNPDLYPGAVTRTTVLRRINEWTTPFPPGDDPKGRRLFYPPDYLHYQTCHPLNPDEPPYPPLPPGPRIVVQQEFWYMVLGEYPDIFERQLISREWIDEAVWRHYRYVAQYGSSPPYSLRPILGLDVSELGDDRNVLIPRYDFYTDFPNSWGGVDIPITAERAARIYQLVNARYINVDGTGVGSAVAPILRTTYGLSANSIKVASAPTDMVPEGRFDRLRDQLWWRAREWLRNGAKTGATLPPDQKLLDELAAPTYGRSERTGDIKICNNDTIREHLDDKRSPDRATAFILTFADRSIDDEGSDVIITNYSED